MQTQINNIRNASINPHRLVQMKEQQQREYFESLNDKPMESRFDKLPVEVRNWLERAFLRCENERQLVARIDQKFQGETREMVGKGGDRFTWQGYSKIADAAIEEYRKRLSERQDSGVMFDGAAVQVVAEIEYHVTAKPEFDEIGSRYSWDELIGDVHDFLPESFCCYRRAQSKQQHGGIVIAQNSLCKVVLQDKNGHSAYLAVIVPDDGPYIDFADHHLDGYAVRLFGGLTGEYGYPLAIHSSHGSFRAGRAA